MANDQFSRGPGNVHPTQARTPHPRRLLLIGHVKPGDEVHVRYWQSRYPVEAAAAAGIGAAEAYVGSGYYAIALEINDQDVQRAFAGYFNDLRVRAFHEHLGQFVEGLPAPGQQFGPTDGFHGDASDDESSGEDASRLLASGDLSFAAGMYRWRAGAAPETGDEPATS